MFWYKRQKRDSVLVSPRWALTDIHTGGAHRGQWPLLGPGGDLLHHHCPPTSNTSLGNQSDLCKHEVINVTSILPIFGWILLFRIKSKLLTVANKTLNVLALSQVPISCPCP